MTALLALAMLLGQSTNFSCMADDTACLKAHGLTPTQGTNSWNMPEPEDVPAVMVIDELSPVRMCSKGEKPTGHITLPSWVSGDAILYCVEPRPTCADKSRILLISEDGTRWCHRVNSWK